MHRVIAACLSAMLAMAAHAEGQRRRYAVTVAPGEVHAVTVSVALGLLAGPYDDALTIADERADVAADAAALSCPVRSARPLLIEVTIDMVRESFTFICVPG